MAQKEPMSTTGESLPLHDDASGNQYGPSHSPWIELNTLHQGHAMFVIRSSFGIVNDFSG